MVKLWIIPDSQTHLNAYCMPDLFSSTWSKSFIFAAFNLDNRVKHIGLLVLLRSKLANWS